jgi:signal recognition particle subunit SRP54
MFENLQDRIEKSFKVLKGQGQITEVNVAETLKEVRRSLLDADVDFKTAKEFTERVKEKALGQNVLKTVSPGQLLVKITHEELKQLMGGEEAELDLEGKPGVMLLAGLQGSGKTTLSGKLAHFLNKKKSKNPLLVAADVYRPAAIDQLHTIAERIGIEVFSDKESKDPVDIAKRGIEYAKEQGYDFVIVDTAGRMAIDQEMMEEVSSLKKALNPNETLFVVDSMTGQDAVKTAKAFNEQLDYDGVVLTKLDGDTRGGAALSIRSVVHKPIKFIGTGEKMDDIDIFYPQRMADRILGMGDVVSLVERAQEQIDEEEARKVQKKLKQDQFDFNDFLKQLEQIKKMGNIKDLMGMIPGMGKALKNMDVDEDSFKGIEAIIRSMTPEERENPKIIDGSRRKRIAQGSGTSVQEVNQLLKQFQETSKMMKKMGNKKDMAKMMQQMQGMGGS